MVKFDGLVENPFEIGIDDLLVKMKLEERFYRHRCVEAWSMTIPWSGFPMKDLVAHAKPLSAAKYVRMETFNNPAVAPGQKQPWNPWPYVEGLTIEEATNELAFMVTGAYGKPMAKQHGAPLRLAVQCAGSRTAALQGPATDSVNRRLRSAKARNRGRWGTEGAAGSMAI